MCELEAYHLGNVFFPSLKTDERLSKNNLGRIIIGGDRGDIEASSAENKATDEGTGVELYDVTFFTTMDCDGYSDEELVFEVQEVVLACYASIQEETFAQQKRLS